MMIMMIIVMEMMDDDGGGGGDEGGAGDACGGAADEDCDVDAMFNMYKKGGRLCPLPSKRKLPPSARSPRRGPREAQLSFARQRSDLDDL